MTPVPKATPREFGQALKRAREGAGLPLEAISDRTKIGTRTLAALEDGEFGRLPNQVFARMFLRQYLDLVGMPHAEWLPAFDAAWRTFADSSQAFPLDRSIPVKRRRVGPWIIGLALVGAGVAGVLLVERRHDAAPATPAAGSAVLTPAPEPAAPLQPAPTPALEPATTPAATPAGAPAPSATTLVVKALQAPCWVEVRIAGEKPTSRLLAAGAAWELPAGGKSIDLVLGDAGAASVAYMGSARSPVGRPGEVARVHLAGDAPPPATP